VVDAGSAALRNTTLARAFDEPSDRAGIEHLYLAALSRRPTADELSYWERFIANAPDRDRTRITSRGPVARLKRRHRIDKGRAKVDRARLGAYEDMFWVLLNSNEFFFIH
jgi:hypothetical protein